MNQKPRVAVLYGGNSTERAVSIKSGKAVVGELRARGWDVVEIDPIGHFMRQVLDSHAEVAFLALHGEFGEDGKIQQILENARIPYTGSGPAASRKGMDKTLTKRTLAANAIATPEYVLAGPHDGDAAIRKAAQRLGFPLVAKPPSGGSSVGVSIAHDIQQLFDAVAEARKYENDVLLERYISGRELTVSVINGRAMPVIEIICPGFFDFKAKYEPGLTQYVIQPALPENVEVAVQQAAAATYTCLGCAGAARVDIRLDAASVPWVLEINTIPGLTATSLLPKAAKAAGIGFGELCESMIVDAINRHRSRTIGDAVVEKRA